MYIYIKRPSLSANAHHGVTDFKLHEILRNKAACLKDGTWLFNGEKNFVTWAWKKNKTFWENIICSIPKSKPWNSWKVFFTANFERSRNLDVKTTTNLPRQKLKGQDMLSLKKVKIAEVSELLILSYTQNRKLANLGNCCFTSNFDGNCNLRCKNFKILTEKKKRKFPKFN